MSDADAPRQLGRLLTGTEAKDIADRLADGDTLTAALKVVAVGQRAEVRRCTSACDVNGHHLPEVSTGHARTRPWDQLAVVSHRARNALIGRCRTAETFSCSTGLQSEAAAVTISGRGLT